MPETKKTIRQLTENETHFLDFDLRYQIEEEVYKVRKHGHKDYPVDVYFIQYDERPLEIIPFHWHKEAEFVYVTEGCGEYRISDDSYLIHEGEALFINSQAMHSLSVAPKSQNYRSINIIFNPDYLILPSQTSLYAKYIYPVTQNQELRAVYISNEDLKKFSIDNSVADILDCNLNEYPGYEIRTRGFLTRLWFSILENIPKNQPAEDNSAKSKISLDEKRTKEALLFIESHYSESITLEEIADSIHLSKSECCRCIKRCLNMTPFEYLMRFRILKSTQIMSTQKTASIADLASAVGFNSCSYFNKLFRKYMGCTPSQYRKKMCDF